MPKSIETSETDLSHEISADLLERGIGNLSKKYRHQNYSKNIYIGTKNAEKWEITRTKLSFKNDVEFVSYLLTLADNDFSNSDRRANSGGGSGGIQFPIHLEPNLNDKLSGSEVNTKEATQKSKSSKRVKKVQFQESLNGQSNGSKSNRDHFVSLRKSEQASFSVLSQNSQDAQDNSITSTIESYCATNLPEVLDCRIAEKIKNELEQKLIGSNGLNKSSSRSCHSEEALCLATNKEKYGGAFDAIHNNNRPHAGSQHSKDLPPPPPVKTKRKHRHHSHSNHQSELVEKQVEIGNDLTTKKITLKIKNLKPDIRKAPADQSLPTVINSLDENGYDDHDDFDNKSDCMDSDKDDEDEDYNSGDEDNDSIVGDDEEDDEDEDAEDDNDDEEKMLIEEADNDMLKTNFCMFCNDEHTSESCPIRNATITITDTIAFIKWTQNHAKNTTKSIKKEEEEQDDDSDEDDDYSLNESCTNNVSVPFAEASLPAQFELKQSSAQIYGIFTKDKIANHTKLGPLVGPIIQEIDIPDDCTMEFIIEAFDGTKSTYYSTENKSKSNWLGYVRVAPTRESRNVVLVINDKEVYFTTCMDIEYGCELLYWNDDCNSAWGRKKVEKMNCGGCNIKFDHPLYYRTHCSVFHDPSFSLTIRKYHCKICGSAVLGKENIMKHAAQMHDGKGAYQCQFCKKYFLRLNYLEMHRTYGCSANPQRARPLCDFCGRKFCQPQKLKVHIKRMHSDMADVLRDFQCKLCSKLLGSRAALQRHSKEVHSRNSAVVSCPRCQKLFQNRSNLKIHMLTHSGVRPFKCIEGECNAAFTTKQCLQFHYKKVHSYAQEQMPKIERSVAYTFDAYSGGMKVEYLEQAPRRRRKSLDDNSSVVNSVMQDNRSETEFSDDNIFENFKKSGKEISNLYKNEPNLSLLTSKIGSILEQRIKQKKRDKKSKSNKIVIVEQQLQQQLNELPTRRSSSVSVLNEPDENTEEFLQTLQQKRHQQNKQLSLIESFLSTAAPRPSTNDIDQLDHIGQNDTYKATDNSDDKIRDLSIHSNNHNSVPTNLIPSKGSRKWISNNDNSDSRDEDSDLNVKLSQPNRDFLSRLMNNGPPNDDDDDDEDENSSFLDVVDTNNGQVGTMPSSQYQNSLPSNANMNLPQLPHLSSLPHLHSQPFISSFYNTNANVPNRNPSTSASMLVEAALNSVGGIMSDDNNLTKHSNNNETNTDTMNNSMEVDMATMNHNHSGQQHQQQQHSDSPTHDNRFTSNMNALTSIENEIKMIKNLNNFPSLPHFSNSSGGSLNNNVSTNMNNHSGHTSSPIQDNNPIGQQDNDIDVDTASTPRASDPNDKLYTDNDNFGGNNNHQQTPPPSAPHVLSPSGRDYSMYNSSNNISSPISQITRRHYPEHELISPASSPALPRYGGFRIDMCRKREMEEQVHNNMIGIDGRNSVHQHSNNNMSSDDENSIMAQNLSIGSHNNNSTEEMRMKFNPPPQMDLMYPKYESNNGGGNAVADLSDLRSKYMDQSMDVPSFRGNNDTLNDMQGLDMTSRPNLSSSFHHNFQLPTTANSNLNIGRYHHHIYDILSEREQQQQEHTQQQLQHQHMQHLLQDQMTSDQEQDQTTSVDLSRSANYAVSSPPPLPYSHSHSDMLRMASLEMAAPNSSSGMVGNRSFISPQLQHSQRDGIDHHRFLSSADQHRLLTTNGADQITASAANHRLLVDPATHLLMEQNSRLLSASDQPRLLADSTSNRHMVSPRGFGAYHQVSTSNYHHSVRQIASSPPNHHTVNPSNYHPFPTYY